MKIKEPTINGVHFEYANKMIDGLIDVCHSERMETTYT